MFMLCTIGIYCTQLLCCSYSEVQERVGPAQFDCVSVVSGGQCLAYVYLYVSGTDPVL